MFETDNQTGLVILPWVLRYFLQLLFSYPVVLIASIPFSAVLSNFGFSGEHSSGKFFGGYEALVCLFIAPFIGWIVGRLKPSFVPSAVDLDIAGYGHSARHRPAATSLTVDSMATGVLLRNGQQRGTGRLSLYPSDVFGD